MNRRRGSGISTTIYFEITAVVRNEYQNVLRLVTHGIILESKPIPQIFASRVYHISVLRQARGEILRGKVVISLRKWFLEWSGVEWSGVEWVSEWGGEGRSKVFNLRMKRNSPPPA